MIKLIAKSVILSTLLSAPCFAESSNTTQSLSSKNQVTANFAVDYSQYNTVLEASVLELARSDRSYISYDENEQGPNLGSNRATDAEANRFYYEQFIDDPELTKSIAAIKSNLLSYLANNQLSKLSNEEQTAFWLNLHNVAVINELAQRYPTDTNSLSYDVADKSSFFYKKLFTYNGQELSLDDIEYKILMPLNKNNPLVMYGLYKGYIGSPNIRTQAYTANNLMPSLIDNAQEFINSNRGTNYSSNLLNVSTMYKDKKAYFNDFNNDLLAHLSLYADNDLLSKLKNKKTALFTIDNYDITDVTGPKQRESYDVIISKWDRTLQIPLHSFPRLNNLNIPAKRIVILRELQRKNDLLKINVSGENAYYANNQ
ncbi:DUF547 domain-containing protein [Pseudoalteromonas sp. SWXJZ94C]|uniref:DUF547 domain-containing protein n=1 Tax=Pseudoalteromonas sp. SWXJZ94C TaxID=2792065 RepID=UPI0018CF8110|nr:DUF547 domain-containing protein [Pseudoalteromonas sp. SWXJZ94C]MBH0059348.1 DUF547 domain-containing protein [Pseudoalteromonas sp. SWXJZ94C]